jgi:hypothetical protein
MAMMQVTISNGDIIVKPSPLRAINLKDTLEVLTWWYGLLCFLISLLFRRACNKYVNQK